MAAEAGPLGGGGARTRIRSAHQEGRRERLGQRERGDEDADIGGSRAEPAGRRERGQDVSQPLSLLTQPNRVSTLTARPQEPEAESRHWRAERQYGVQTAVTGRGVQHVRSNNRTHFCAKNGRSGNTNEYESMSTAEVM